jgi:hypothetical protein
MWQHLNFGLPSSFPDISAHDLHALLTFAMLIAFIYYIHSDHYFVLIYLGFYHRWNSSFERRHPSLWLFIRKLKDEQKLAEISIQAVHNGVAPAPRKKKWRDFETRLQRLKDQYAAGARTLDQYWDAVAATIRAFR